MRITVKHLGLVAASVCMSLPGLREARAQASPTATGPGSYVSIGLGVSGFQQDYGQHYIGGETAYVDANLYRRIGIEAEARRLNDHTSEDVHQSTYLGGVKISTNPRAFRPYIKLLAGRGRMVFPFRYATGTYFVVAPAAGLDYHLGNSRFGVRVIEFEYQIWPQFSFGELHPYGLTTGISFDLFSPSGKLRGKHF